MSNVLKISFNVESKHLNENLLFLLNLLTSKQDISEYMANFLDYITREQHQ